MTVRYIWHVEVIEVVYRSSFGMVLIMVVVTIGEGSERFFLNSTKLFPLLKWYMYGIGIGIGGEGTERFFLNSTKLCPLSLSGGRNPWLRFLLIDKSWKYNTPHKYWKYNTPPQIFELRYCVSDSPQKQIPNTIQEMK